MIWTLYNLSRHSQNCFDILYQKLILKFNHLNFETISSWLCLKFSIFYIVPVCITLKVPEDCPKFAPLRRVFANKYDIITNLKGEKNNV